MTHTVDPARPRPRSRRGGPAPGDGPETTARRVWVAAVAVVVVTLAGWGVVALRPAETVAAARLRVTTAVSCPDPGRCLAFDDMGDVSVLRRGAWSAPTPIDTRGITAASCPTPTFCVAVDGAGEVMTLHGSHWSPPQSVDGRSAGASGLLGLVGFDDVSCATPRFCVAVDALGRAVRFDGRHWTHPHDVQSNAARHVDFRTASAAVSADACPVPGRCMAVTVAGGAVPFGGGAWQAGVTVVPGASEAIAHLERFPALSSVSCATAASCVATDSLGDAYLYDGRGWTTVPAVDPRMGSARHGDSAGPMPVSCPTPTFCVVLDSVGDAVVYDGATWSAPTPVEPTSGFTALSCAGPAFCVGLDDLGRAVVFDGTAWSAPVAVQR
ncbi:MAG TPA: hypothetical protein VMB72_16680 [Acidimicrobiales bacterium]|nr:hypothetical protein [Acidimicrobiales bacterium]